MLNLTKHIIFNIMSQFIYLVFDQKLGQKTPHCESLVTYMEELENLADKLKVKPLSHFDGLSENNKFLEEISNYKGDPLDIFEKYESQAIFYPASTGLKTTSALIQYLTEKPATRKNLDAALEEIEKLHHILLKAQIDGVKFRVAISE